MDFDLSSKLGELREIIVFVLDGFFQIFCLWYFLLENNQFWNYFCNLLMTSHLPTFYTQRFNDKEELLCFLQRENNSYSTFILEKWQNPPLTPNGSFHKHHIQPRHAGGPDVSWNMVSLSYNDHAQAHQLLFECYGNLYDKGAYDMMKGNSLAGMALIRKENQKKMKQNQVGF